MQPYHDDSNDQLRTHLSDFIAAYNYAKRLKTLGGLTAYGIWARLQMLRKGPDRFTLDPINQMPGLNI